jgi:hypothetical protein
MEVKIGIHSVPRELVVETDTPAEEVERLLSSALEKGEHAVFALSLIKGGRVLVPADKIAYVEFGGAEARRVGFGNIALCPFVMSGGPGEGPGPAPGIVDND